MTDPTFGPFTIVILFITMIHFPILGIILIIWAQDQLKKRDLEVYARLEGIAKDLGVWNSTFPPQKGCFYFRGWSTKNESVIIILNIIIISGG